jgi:hypothetical protein
VERKFATRSTFTSCVCVTGIREKQRRNFVGDVTVKRPRGRPRKESSESGHKPNMQANVESTTSKPTQGKSGEFEPKKRGRPRKAPARPPRPALPGSSHSIPTHTQSPSHTCARAHRRAHTSADGAGGASRSSRYLCAARAIASAVIHIHPHAGAAAAALAPKQLSF